uniref:Deoxyguanosinetriphosphate triphosphohydrolase-like protein n=1 Tax=Candidatus Methanophagaceae archaeon ANME-1 ERB6 TaxID=2759912 RepID=A0A7G9YZ09_9EURY|nr:deoxyguanosinetriphosphate triphosphohydrolase-like protein [Methanosarcinales archaeon ANME-1 ERB6]
MRKVIKDPLHGYIEIDDLAIAIIDTVEMQRLRRIRQLGFSYLVYPGANHTRFEHSLGVYHLICLLLDRLEVAKEEEQELIVASLIHDIGHGPYSHVTEPVIKKITGKSHEDIEDIIFKQEVEIERELEVEVGSAKTIAEVLDELSLDKQKIAGYIKGEGRAEYEEGERDLSKVLNGEIDVDKMDYLVRDSYYTGVAYGVVDNIRIIQGLDFANGKVVITEKGILPAEYLLFSRFLMYPTVYKHHTSRIAQLMFSKALAYFVKSKSESEDHIRQYALALRRMDDSEINIALRNAKGYPEEMVERINKRQLFKRAVYKGINELKEDVAAQLSEEKRRKEIEEEISKRAGVDEKYVILDFQGEKGEELKESVAKVVVDKPIQGLQGREQSAREIKSLREVSSLVSMLSQAFRENYKVGVYTPARYREEVKEAAEMILWR